MDKYIQTILQNTYESRYEIVGLYGVKDNQLIEPTDPECHLVVVLRGTCGRFLYFIEEDEFSMVGIDDKIPLTQHLEADVLDILRECKKRIKAYLDVGELVIAKDIDYGKFFNKQMMKQMILPLVRKTYPQMVAKDLVSVQPLCARNSAD